MQNKKPKPKGTARSVFLYRDSITQLSRNPCIASGEINAFVSFLIDAIVCTCVSPDGCQRQPFQPTPKQINCLMSFKNANDVWVNANTRGSATCAMHFPVPPTHSTFPAPSATTSPDVCAKWDTLVAPPVIAVPPHPTNRDCRENSKCS